MPAGLTPPTVEATGLAQRYQFQGREASANAGAPMFYRNRMYSAGLGRFGRRDSEYDEGNQYNAYSAFGGNGVGNLDPMGLLKLEQHEEATMKAYEAALKAGHLKKIDNAWNRTVFETYLRIGCKLPDIQYVEVGEGLFLKSLKDKLPDEVIQRAMQAALAKAQAVASAAAQKAAVPIQRAKKAVYEAVVPEDIRQEIAGIQQEVSADVQTIKYWWVDNSVAEPLIEAGSEKFPELKDVKIIRTHFFDMQWQHGMGTGDHTRIRDSLVDDTTTRILAYRKALADGDYKEAGLNLGMIMHYVEDTWTPSHTAREGGKIRFFYDYGKQSPDLHAMQDKPASDSPVMRGVIGAATNLVRLATSNKNEAEIRAALRNEVYDTSAYDPNYKGVAAFAPRAKREDVYRIADKYVRRFLPDSMTQGLPAPEQWQEEAMKYLKSTEFYDKVSKAIEF